MKVLDVNSRTYHQHSTDVISGPLGNECVQSWCAVLTAVKKCEYHTFPSLLVLYLSDYGWSVGDVIVNQTLDHGLHLYEEVLLFIYYDSITLIFFCLK